jgi:pimeloyl-ACP methyl ester carboxylesterase
MLVIQGLDDDVAPPENGRSLARDHPGRVRLLEVAGSGHEVLAERPDVVVPAIVAFVREIERKRPQVARSEPKANEAQ